MAKKREIQKRIIENNLNNLKISEEEFMSILRSVAPGTNLRTGLDGALKIGNGALIVIENEMVPPLLEGGFRINCKFTPQRLMELCKMDGAIILSKDLKRITHSNVLIVPDSKISSHETGTRHKAAERTAKQADTLTIAISERRSEITLYYKNLRYSLLDAGEILRKANENFQLLEKQRDLFDRGVEKLTRMEIRNNFNLKQAIAVIQKGKLIQKLFSELKKNSVELGKEGTILRIRLKEVTLGVDKETELVIKDYALLDLKRSRLILDNLSYDEILDEEVICSILGYENSNVNAEIKGWRILSKTSLSDAESALLIREDNHLGNILNLNAENLKNVFEISKAHSFLEELSKIKKNY
jgi:diadenylate cyclase